MQETVSKHYAESIFALFQFASQIESNVKRLMFVICPSRIEKMIANLFSVEAQLKLPQA